VRIVFLRRRHSCSGSSSSSSSKWICADRAPPRSPARDLNAGRTVFAISQHRCSPTPGWLAPCIYLLHIHIRPPRVCVYIYARKYTTRHGYIYIVVARYVQRSWLTLEFYIAFATYLLCAYTYISSIVALVYNIVHRYTTRGVFKCYTRLGGI